AATVRRTARALRCAVDEPPPERGDDAAGATPDPLEVLAREVHRRRVVREAADDRGEAGAGRPHAARLPVAHRDVPVRGGEPAAVREAADESLELAAAPRPVAFAQERHGVEEARVLGLRRPVVHELAEVDPRRPVLAAVEELHAAPEE